ncbi:RNase H-like domain-containing protein, partial [Salmonella enterica]|uniref:RNase H-like domain-containing protein n=1 Tax=Salmonella enterica TaxID=28901 RepID=UPI0034DD04AD
MKNYPVPYDADSATRFVAFCNFYRRFIKNFANYSRHITRLCKKNVPFEWSSECQNAFEYLKENLMHPTLLQYPDFRKEFCIITDA